MTQRKPKKYKIPSRSEKNVFRYVTVWPDGMMRCSCPAKDHKECWHIRRYKKWKGEVKGNPDKCFYTGDNRHLEEHHLYRGSDRKHSLSVYLTHWIHVKATRNKEFEKHLAKLYFNKEKMKNIKAKAKIKEVSIKNLESSDKSVWVDLQSSEIEEALKFGKLRAEQMVKVESEDKENKFYALVKSTKKQNYANKDPIVEMRLDVAPAETMNAYVFGAMNPGEKVEITHSKP